MEARPEDYSKYSLEPINEASSKEISANLPSLAPFISRSVILSSKNTSLLTKDNYFLFYELILTDRTPINLRDLFELLLLKELSITEDKELVILVADSLFYSKSKKNFAQIKKIALEKLKNIKALLSYENPKEKLIHYCILSEYIKNNPNFEVEVSQFKIKTKYVMVKALFHINDEDNINLLDYPCYLSNILNSKMLPKLFGDKNLHALIIADNKNAYRYQLANYASEIRNFEKPIIISYKNICQLSGNPNETCFEDDYERNLFSDDDDKAIKKKMLKFSLSGSRGNGTLEEHKKLGGDVEADVACRYLKYFEKDQKIFEEKTTLFGKGEISCGEIKLVVVDILNKLFDYIRKNKIEEELKDEIFI